MVAKLFYHNNRKLKQRRRQQERQRGGLDLQNHNFARTSRCIVSKFHAPALLRVREHNTKIFFFFFSKFRQPLTNSE